MMSRPVSREPAGGGGRPPEGKAPPVIERGEDRLAHGAAGEGPRAGAGKPDHRQGRAAALNVVPLDESSDYSLLRTVEDIFGLPHLGDAAQPAVRSFGLDVFG